MSIPGMIQVVIAGSLVAVSYTHLNLANPDEGQLAKITHRYLAHIRFASLLSLIHIFPFMIVYPFLQKYFVKGVNIGAVKE